MMEKKKDLNREISFEAMSRMIYLLSPNLSYIMSERLSCLLLDNTEEGEEFVSELQKLLTRYGDTYEDK